MHLNNSDRFQYAHTHARILSLTGSKCGGGDLYLAVGQVRLERRQWGGGGWLSREQIRWLCASGARAGPVTSNVRLLFVKHRHQLQSHRQQRERSERNDSFILKEKITYPSVCFCAHFEGSYQVTEPPNSEINLPRSFNTYLMGFFFLAKKTLE